MIEKLQAFHERFFALFKALDQARPILTDDAYLEMAQDILSQYKEEYKLFNLQYSTDRKREIKRLKQRQDILVPDRWRKWLRWRQNEAQTILDAEVALETSEYFQARQEALAARYKAEQESDAAWEIADDGVIEDGPNETVVIRKDSDEKSREYQSKTIRKRKEPEKGAECDRKGNQAG